MKDSVESVFKARITKLLSASKLVKSIYYFENLDSTQDYANSLPHDNSLHGTLIIAKSQKMGKGRIGRSWISPHGGIWMSIVLVPDFSIDNLLFTQFIGALAVAEAINETTEINCRVKWPNDVLINGKKVCGILVDVNLESQKKTIILGIGLNANVESSLINKSINGDVKATSIKEEYGNEIDLVTITDLIINKIEYYYYNLLRTGKSMEILDRWKQQSDMFGRRAVVYDGTQKFSGEVVDLDNSGSLIMRLDDSSIKKIIYFNNVSSS
jgi:BirA family transcriptional regulator, biotin operon repressor / biotin---[acetyl-CoA-carboxylase] ligase